MAVSFGNERAENFEGSREAIGRCMAALMPVPRMYARRVAGSR